MSVHGKNRNVVLDQLYRELVGPDPAGEELETQGEIIFDSWARLYGPWRQKGSGEEILTRDRPVKRYGVGVLFPARTPLEEILSRDDDVPDDVTPQEPTTGEVDTEFAAAVGPAESESEEFDLSLANAYQPSSIGVSFLADFPEHSELVVEVTGGRYQKKTVWLKSETVPKEPTSNQGQSSRDKRRSRTWWLRTPLSFQTVFQSNELAQNRNVLLR